MGTNRPHGARRMGRRREADGGSRARVVAARDRALPAGIRHRLLLHRFLALSPDQLSLAKRVHLHFSDRSAGLVDRPAADRLAGRHGGAAAGVTAAASHLVRWWTRPHIRSVTSDCRIGRGAGMTEKIQKSDAEWRAQLSPEEYGVTRRHGTERAFTGRYHDTKAPGTYQCLWCGKSLLSSKT